MISISVRADVTKLRRSLSDFAQKQVPFATALALTAVARNIQAAETAALPRTFDKPTPFTMRAFGVTPARKTTLTAVVFAKDIQAQYLLPFEVGGRQLLGSKRGLPVPSKKQPVNAYGNLPRGTIARLKALPNVFFGTVMTKNGPISGIWQRGRAAVAAQTTGPKRRKARPRVPMKLLIHWTSGTEVHEHLDYRQRAEAVVKATFHVEFERAIGKALATAR